MADQCLTNIQAEQPPYNVPCSDAYCAQKSGTLNKGYCHDMGFAPGTPVPLKENGKPCSCCCSCYALNTPIEATKGEFVLIQHIQRGDTVLTAGIDLNWTPGVVQDRTGDITKVMVPGLYLVRFRMPDEKTDREILVTSDHLFLMHTSKTLKKVQHLIPGNNLTTADGKAAPVTFVAMGEYATAIHSINMKGKFDGKDLTGHLINANGIVSTDYSVQVYFETGNLAKELAFNFSSQAYAVGTAGYIEKFESKDLSAFLSNPDQWPKGFMPKRKPLVNVPAGSASFLTIKQAKDVKANSDFNDYNTFPVREAIKQLFALFSSYKPHVNYILDWDNENVNAYAWTTGRQDYILLTGGLARVKGLFKDAFSVIIADMIARLDVGNCVAEGDYKSIDILRIIFPSSFFYTLSTDGVSQITEFIFDKILPDHKEGNKNDVCYNPSINCRLEAFENAQTFSPMPMCGVPLSAYFNLERAYASFDFDYVTVIFNNPVDPVTAESLINYNIQPGVVVTEAKVSSENSSSVNLSVTGLEPASKYILSVTNVTSIYNQGLGEQNYTVIVTR